MKNIALKLAVFLSLITLLQIAIYELQGGDDHWVPEDVSKLRSAAESDTDVIFLGDSTVTWVPRDQTGGDSLADQLRKIFRPRSFAVVSHFAGMPRLYRDQVFYMVHRSYRPRVLILPLNLRSFSPIWDYQPRWQFAQECFFLRHDYFLARVFFKALVGWNAVTLTLVSQDQYNVKVPSKALASTRGVFSVSYDYDLETNNRQLEALRELAKLLNRHKISVVAYLLPVNVEVAQRHLGDGFHSRLKAKAAVIQSVLAKEGIRSLDFSTALPAAAFDRPPSAHEHLRAEGTAWVAAQIQKAVWFE